MLERVQRVWTSDMTDALARQQIQRWTTQLVAPEYVGAHVSSPTSHTTGRTFSLDFRAATALFGSFGIEWDLTEASEDDLEELARLGARYKRFRPLLHSGRVVRPESLDPTVLLHGVVADDRARHWWRTCSSTSRRTTAGPGCGFPGSTSGPPTRRGGRGRSSTGR